MTWTIQGHAFLDVVCFAELEAVFSNLARSQCAIKLLSIFLISINVYVLGIWFKSRGYLHPFQPTPCFWFLVTEDWMNIAFIIIRKRNNVVVSFGTLKVQSFMLTEVRDCDLLIVVTSSTFLKRKEILKGKKQLAQIIKARSPAYI